MTIRTKRRGRRSLAAILAAMLMASVLSVVAGAPAQAANTSGEYLAVDTNADGKGDARGFAGAHRYITAQLLADAYAANAGSPSSVIIASGETEVDAVTAAGLASDRGAPVLLTRSSMLPHNVARYIDENNVTEVIVVGGTASVPDAVVTAIEGLGSRPKVERISGADRYATAAAIGNRLGGPNPTWCGSDQSAALLVNGGDAGRADAIAAGPLAFGLELPVLLTGSDELPQATVDFLTDNKVEHVVIVGGTGAVPDSIREAMIEDIGVVSVRRIAGANAAATSVMLAKEMLGKCAAVLNPDLDMVALVNRDATADGIAAAPTMGYGLGNGPVPILLVDDTLPAAVSDYLASTAEVRGGMKTHQKIVAVGGTAVVSNDVMAAAVEAAKTSPKLTATIGFSEKPNPKQFTVTYSDDVKLPEDASGNTIYLGTNSNLTYKIANGTVFDPTLYEVNGRRIEGLLADDANANVPETQLVAEKIHVEDRTIVITLSHELKDGDKIGVVGGAKIGANGDMRSLEAASHTVSRTAPAVDRTAPTVEIVTGVGQTTVSIFVVEAKPLMVSGNPYIAAGGATLQLKGATKASTLNLGTPAKDMDANRPGTGIYRYDVTVAALKAGDVIQVARNTFRDTGNRGNSLTRHTVTAAPAKLAISSASLGEPKAKASASVDIENAAGAATMTVTAKSTGAASGASGNGWVIYGLDDSAGTTPAAAADIDVDVDMKHRIITYTVNKLSKHKNSPTLFELARALSGNEQFSDNFSVTFINAGSQDKDDKAGVIDSEGLVLSGGISQVAMRVQFNQPVMNSDLTMAFARSLGGVSLPTTTTIGQLWATPDDEVNYTYETCSTSACSLMHLPQRVGSRVVTVRGEARIIQALRLDASLKPFDAPSGPSGVPVNPPPAPNNPPVFTDGVAATRSIPENSPAGTAVGAPVAATDADDDTLSYFLLESGQSTHSGTSFTIDGATGQLRTKAGVTYDYETKSTYSVVVGVDDGHRNDWRSIPVVIMLTDVNEPTADNAAPTFAQSNYVRSLPENSDGTSATVTVTGGAVTADDENSTDTTITYVTSDSDFTMDTNGVITYVGSGSGDYENFAGNPSSAWVLTVTATSSDGTQARELTATTTVTVRLTDADDPPVITVPTGGLVRSFDENVDGSSTAEDLGAALTATDQDGNAITGYTITEQQNKSGSDVTIFGVTAAGQLQYTGDGEDYDNYAGPWTLKVTATSNSVDSDPVTVTVNLDPVTEKPAAVASLSAGSATVNGATITWTRMVVTDRPEITSYDVQYAVCENSDQSECTDAAKVQWSAWSTSVSKAQPSSGSEVTHVYSTWTNSGTVHKVRVRAVNSDGDGAWADAVTVTTSTS